MLICVLFRRKKRFRRQKNIKLRNFEKSVDFFVRVCYNSGARRLTYSAFVRSSLWEEEMNIAIVDSSITDAGLLEEYFKKYFAGTKVSLCCIHFSDGVKFLDSDIPFDLVFMETALPYRNGFRIAESMRKTDQDTALVFYSAHNEWAIRGYEYDAVDFLVKPLDYATFEVHFKRILRRSRIEVELDEGYVLVKTKKKIVRVRADDIKYVEVEGHSCVYHLLDRDLLVTFNLARVVQSIPYPQFEYCNSGYFVNLKHVSKIEDGYAYIGATPLKISRSRIKNFTKRYLEIMEQE